MTLTFDIEKTIKYGEKFGVKVNIDQLKRRLISKTVYPLIEIEEKAKDFGLKKNNSISKRTKEKITYTNEILSRLRKIDGLLFIGITGSISFDNTKENDDIDLMIICKKNKLWSTRLHIKTFLFKEKIPYRKYGKVENNNELCLNLWITEDSLLIPEEKQNLKNALDLVNIIPIINRKNTFEKFLKTNAWVKKYVATPYFYLKQDIENIENKAPFLSLFFVPIEYIAYLVQLVIIKSKRKKDIVDFKRAYFHDKVEEK